MALFYLAGPLFSPHERRWLETLDGWLSEAGHRTFLPHRDAGDTLETREEPSTALRPGAAGEPTRSEDAKARAALFAADAEAVIRCDALVAVLDGPDVDSGTAFEIGLAWALRKPALGLRRDLRTLGPEGPVNLMVEHACTRFEHLPAGADDDVRSAVLSFASEVAPHAGLLVRDGVPRLARERAVPLSFHKAPAEELPRLLKERIWEEARSLQRAAPGDELEEVADVLEAVEALCRVRGYDRETLRNLKQSKWKRKGGFEEGWVVEREAPKPE